MKLVLFLALFFKPVNASEKMICMKESDVKKLGKFMGQCVQALEACDKAFKRKAAICPFVKLNRKPESPSNVSEN
jgi:hypothetical protein